MKKILITLTLVLALVVPALPAKATNLLQEQCSQPGASSTPTCEQNAGQSSTSSSNLATNNPVAGPSGVLQTVTNIMALLTGIVAVFMIIASGFTFITAGGNLAGQRAGDNPSKAKKARAQLSAAVVGLLIVALSWSILSFIIEKFVK